MKGKKMKELNLKNDIVFKAFFAKKGNEKFLKSFLESILNVEIKKIEIVGEANLLQLSKTDKLGRLDIKATIKINFTWVEDNKRRDASRKR